MSWFSSSLVRRTLLVLVPALIAVLPLLSWAQGSTPPAQGTTITLPSSAASKDSAMKTAAAAGAHKAPTLSDSTRAALKSQIERELKAMADTLKLTPEQRAKARPILLDHAYQVKQLREKYARQENDACGDGYDEEGDADAARCHRRQAGAGAHRRADDPIQEVAR